VPTTTSSYAARAEEYIALLGSMSAVHPSDRQLVDTWAEDVRGPVLDAGCGPGHWTRHLVDLGVDAYGIDVVPGFLDHARAAHPGIRFAQQSIDRIEEEDAALGGVLSWFSTIHHEPDRMRTPLAEFARVLRSGGGLVLGFFSGDRVEPFDHAIARAYRWPAAELRDLLDAAGFDVIETQKRQTRGERPVGAIVGERRPS
jgi:SAM-dependent methyltransferase